MFEEIVDRRTMDGHPMSTKAHLEIMAQVS